MRALMRRLVMLIAVMSCPGLLMGGRTPLAAQQVPGQPQEQQILVSTYTLMEKSAFKEFYAVTPQWLVRAEYWPVKERRREPWLLIETLANKEGARLTAAQVAQRFRGAKDADLIIRGCGQSFGNDDCDYYSPLKASISAGPKISPGQRQIFLALVTSLREELTSK